MAKAVIFDFDGVIADSMEIIISIESDVLAKMGIDLSPAVIVKKYSGWGDDAFFKEMNKIFNVDVKVENWVKEKALRYEEKLQYIKPIDGALDLIKSLHKNEFKLAIGSGSPIYFLEKISKKFGIYEKFSALVSADDVALGKPAPDTFLRAAELLSVDPSDCVVIEDGVCGMIAAKAAGMKCIGLVEDQYSRDYPADRFVKSLRELRLEDFI